MSSITRHISRNRTTYLFLAIFMIINSLVFTLAISRDQNRVARSLDC